MVVVEGATVTSVVTEATTMLVIGLILSMFGIGLFCWLLFTLAVYALPFFAGVTAGLAAFHSGAGAIGAIMVGLVTGAVTLGAIMVGLVTGAVTLGAGQVAFALVRSPFIRAAIALLFAAPAAGAGYHATLALADIGVPSAGWGEAFAIIGAILVGGAAWGRMTLFADPLGTGRPSVPGPAQPMLTGAAKAG
jgi:hypothetical protein